MSSASSSSVQNQIAHPLFYFCPCGEKMFVRTSWTALNPARRFIMCPNVKNQNCVRYRFLDDELTDYYKKVVYELRMENMNNLRNLQLEHEVTDTKMELMKKMEELSLVKSKLKMFDKLLVVLVVVVSMLCSLVAFVLMK